MEILGLALQDFIFSIFLPFLFFYILLYALLRKSRILGDPRETNTMNTLLALVISALSILSLYSMGLASLLPILGAITAVSAFIIMFLLGITGYSANKTRGYVSGDAFKTEDEKKFDAGVKNCEKIWERVKKEPNDQKALQEMSAEVSNLEPLAKKLGRSLYDYSWYKEFKDLMSEVEKRSKQ